MEKTAVGRRVFIIATAGAAAAACTGGDNDAAGDQPTPTGPGTDGVTGPGPGGFSESPMLAQRVAAGELPPLAERLPTEPLVVGPGQLLSEDVLVPEIGIYGGPMQLGHPGTGGNGMVGVGSTEPLVWAPGGFDFEAGIEGNVVAGWETNGDATRFTFHLRDGLRWSDGEPVTIDDVRFAFEDVLSNSQLTPEFPPYLRAGYNPAAAPAALEVVDDLTFSLMFDRPYGAFPSQLAISQWRGYLDIIKPRHYLEQFHETYASRAQLLELLEAESLPEDEWFNLFITKHLPNSALDLSAERALNYPMLTAWTLVRVSDNVFTYERNPYYFKVDPAGNQLPYIDTIRSQGIEDMETLTSRALFGEFDFLGDHATVRTLPAMAQEAESSEIQLLVSRSHALPAPIMFNLTYEDETWRQVVRDVRFRRAMSLAINRQEIIDNIFLGEFASVPSTVIDGEWDVAEANRLLDELGLDQRDGEGFRLGPDGQRFEIPLEHLNLNEDFVPIGELVTEYWNAVGVHTTLLPAELGDYITRLATNQLQAHIWILAGSPFWRTAGWDDYLPLDRWGLLWQNWYKSEGAEGEEPPDEVKELFEAHTSLMSAEVGSPESRAAYETIVENFRENVWSILPVEESYFPTFFSGKVRNVPTGVGVDVMAYMVIYAMEQWYLDES